VVGDGAAGVLIEKRSKQWIVADGDFAAFRARARLVRHRTRWRRRRARRRAAR